MDLYIFFLRKGTQHILRFRVQQKPLSLSVCPRGYGDFIQLIVQWYVIAMFYYILEFYMNRLEMSYHAFLLVVVFDVFE